MFKTTCETSGSVIRLTRKRQQGPLPRGNGLKQKQTVGDPRFHAPSNSKKLLALTPGSNLFAPDATATPAMKPIYIGRLPTTDANGPWGIPHFKICLSGVNRSGSQIHPPARGCAAWQEVRGLGLARSKHVARIAAACRREMRDARPRSRADGSETRATGGPLPVNDIHGRATRISFLSQWATIRRRPL